MTIEEFYSEFWGNKVSEYVVTTEMIIENQEFIDEITFEMYRMFLNADIPMNILARMTESFFKNMRIYKPKC